MNTARSALALVLSTALLLGPSVALAQLAPSIPAPAVPAISPPADTTPPSISGVAAVSISSISESLAWTTNELTVSTFEYSTTQSYGSSANISASLAIGGMATLVSLLPSTTYYYCIHATDASNNSSQSCSSFATAAAPVVAPPVVPVQATTTAPVIIADTTPPTINNISSVSLEPHTATVLWTTDELAASTLEYGPTMNYASTATLSTTALLSHSATLLGLTANTKYYYCIRATDLYSNTASSCSSSNFFTTVAQQVLLDTIPPTISLVTVAPVATSSADFAWVTDEVGNGYIEYGVTNGYGSQTQLDTALTLQHTASVLGLAPSTTYHYRVHSSDEAGNVSVTPDETFTTATPSQVQEAPLIDLGAPGISQVTHARIGSTDATISWSTDEGAVSTFEYGTTTAYGLYATLSASALLAHEAVLTNLAPSTTYHYCIHARDFAHNTTNSCGYSFTTAPPPLVIDAPVISAVGANTIGETSATVNWTTDLPADSLVEYGNSENLGSSGFSATLVTSHAVTLAGLTSDTNYQFRIVSKPAAGSAYAVSSSLHEFSTLAVPIIIDPPANILSVSSSNVAATDAFVSWTTDEAAQTSVEYGTTTAYGASTTPNTSLQTSGTISLTSLLPSTTYHFRTKAIDAADNITYSEDYTLMTSGAPVPSTSSAGAISVPVSVGSSSGGGSYSSVIPTPALITAASVDSQIVLIWNKPEEGGVVGTSIFRKEGWYPASPQDGQVIYQGSAETFTDTALQNGKTYYYSAYSYTASGSYSKPVHIATAPAAGVMQVQLDENPVLEPSLAVEHFPTDIKLGDKSLEVEHLQQVLNTVNVHQSGLTTGYFGPLTEAAIKKFQAKYNLPHTGLADEATRAVLSSLSQGWVIAGAPNGLARLQTDLRRGDTGQDVANLQEFLDYEGSYEEGIISGIYGPLTQESVADFQTTHGVTPVSGTVGPKTRHTIQTVLGF